MKIRKQKKNKKITTGKQSVFLQISVMLLALGMNWAGLFAIGETIAYYSDVETSSENVFGAGSLDFSLTDTDFDFSIGLTEKIDFSSILTNSGTLPFVYDVEAEKISGSDTFCDALELEAERNGIEIYDDPFALFEAAESSILGTFDFEIKLLLSASDVAHGEECEVDFVFRGWQSELSYPEGFTDEERINITFTSRMIALNEFLPNPGGIAYGFDFGKDSDDMPQGEWVELYNNSDESFDLEGWYVWDASASEANKIFITEDNTAPATTVIDGKDWLVVYMEKAVLNNTGDTVKLYDDSDTLIDSHTYTGDPDYCEIEPTPGDENSTTTTGDCGGVPPNKSYARIPDGIGGWVDPIPTPGRGNRLETNDDGGVLFFAPASSSGDSDGSSGDVVAEEEVPPANEEEITQEENQNNAPEEDEEIISEEIVSEGENAEEVIENNNEAVIEETSAEGESAIEEGDTAVGEENAGEITQDEVVGDNSATDGDSSATDEEIIEEEPAIQNEPITTDVPVNESEDDLSLLNPAKEPEEPSAPEVGVSSDNSNDNNQEE